MKCTRELVNETVSAGLILATVLFYLASSPSGCGGTQEPQAYAPNAKFVAGLGYCVADVALTKEEMRRSDAGIDRAALARRYEACSHNVEAAFGYEADTYGKDAGK